MMATEPNHIADSFPIERAAALRLLLADRLAGDLASFAKKAWKVLNPTRPLIWSWHYDYLCEMLTLVKQRRLLRLIINIPPRTLKSSLVTVIYPSWVWLSEPEHNFLTASYSLDLSTEHSVTRRSLLQSLWFQRLFGDRFQLAGDRNQVAQYANDRRGQMIATSVGATTMGRGCDTAILDDPVSADQAVSDAERTTANTWIDATLRSRLNDPARGAIIVVMQRLHELDATGFLLEQEPGVWTHVRIPLVAEEDETWTFPISGRIVQRKAGDILMPERFTPEVVDQHLDAAATEAEIRRQRDAHRWVNAVLVEDKANGPAVVQRLKVNLPGVIEINPQGGKIARMFAAAAEWQAGDWFVDRNAAWSEPFIEQITMFPNAAHDDMADAMSQASAWLLQHRRRGWMVTDAFTGRMIDDFTY